MKYWRVENRSSRQYFETFPSNILGHSHQSFSVFFFFLTLAFEQKSLDFSTSRKELDNSNLKSEACYSQESIDLSLKTVIYQSLVLHLNITFWETVVYSQILSWEKLSEGQNDWWGWFKLFSIFESLITLHFIVTLRIGISHAVSLLFFLPYWARTNNLFFRFSEMGFLYCNFDFFFF